MRGVNLDDLEARRQRTFRCLSKRGDNFLESLDFDNSRGTVYPASNASALGPTGSQPPSCTETGFPPVHGGAVLAFLPACANCIPGDRAVLIE